MEALMIIVFIIFIIAMYFVQTESHSTRINSYVESLGGKLIDYERRSIFSGLGPFMVVGKGRTVYCIKYEVNGDKREGWVRFGGIGGPDWRS